MERAWAVYLPSVELQEALQTVRQQNDAGPTHGRQTHLSEVTHATEQPPAISAEHSSAEDYEFDESQDVGNSTDGMGLLTVEPHKAGYMSPQSGTAALKFLHSLPLYLPLTSFSPTSSLDDDDQDAPSGAMQQRRAEVLRYLDDYFASYHPAYPILHEGTFRARVSGSTSSEAHRRLLSDSKQAHWLNRAMAHGRYCTTSCSQSGHLSGTPRAPGRIFRFSRKRASTCRWTSWKKDR